MGRRTTRNSIAAATSADDDGLSNTQTPAPLQRPGVSTGTKVTKTTHHPASSFDKQKILLSSDTGHFSLIKALHLADLITLMNGFCGILSIFCSLRHCLADVTLGGVDTAGVSSHRLRHIYMALLLLPFGLAFDFLDGRVARWRKKSSLMGQELDSLADLISFGVAPAVAAFSIGMRTDADSICLAFFVLCGILRLARFNVTVQALPKDSSGKSTYFEGTPIPTTLGLDALMAVWLWKGWADAGCVPGGTIMPGTVLEFHPAVMLFVLHGFLMTSRSVKIPKP
jgi:CDP-diacylglycerol--serine O-phosphatidyltransferase